jgi:hypothetical protein
MKTANAMSILNTVASSHNMNKLLWYVVNEEGRDRKIYFYAYE